MTQYNEVVSAFESIIKCKYKLSDSLVEQSFKNSLGQYELDLENLGYDSIAQEFIRPSQDSDSFEPDGRLKYSVVITLAEIMKSYYMEQEVRRVNQLNNIIGKDISLNGTGDTKNIPRQKLTLLMKKLHISV